MNLEPLFNNDFQNSLERMQNSKLVSSKPAHMAPPIDHEEGEYYVLKNGNLILKEKYNSMWHPVKTPVLPFGTKGDNPDKTKVI